MRGDGLSHARHVRDDASKNSQSCARRDTIPWGLIDGRPCVVSWWEKSTAMGLVTPILAASAGGLVALLVAIGLVVLNYWATSRIIAQAGYSPLWILVPVAPFVLTIICIIIWVTDVRSAFYGGGFVFGSFTNVGLAWHLDEISIFVNWIFFLVFAFSRWPVSGAHHPPSVVTPRPPDSFRATPGPASVPPTPGATVASARVVPASGAGPGSGPAVASPSLAKRTGAQFCPWCAEPLPGNRALFHDCGAKDRPETFCKNCGKALPTGSSVCNECAVV